MYLSLTEHSITIQVGDKRGETIARRRRNNALVATGRRAVDCETLGILLLLAGLGR